MALQDIPSIAPAPRLCHLVKWADFDGYGFNLHAEKLRSGQFIGKVDDDSPAQHAGLREGDRIIEVNGVNIANENHRQVVERIKSIPNETKLLVVDEAADRYYKEKKIVVKSTQSNVLYMKTPVPRPPAGDPPSYENISLPLNGVEKSSAVENGFKSSPETPKAEVQSNGTTHRSPAEKPKSAEKAPKEEKAPKKDPKPELPKEQSPKGNGVKINGSPKAKEEVNSRSSTPMDGSVGSSVPDSPQSTKSSSSSGGNSDGGGNSAHNGPSSPDATDGLNLNMSASEMRQILAQRKKKDPKKVQMDIRQKFEIIQEM